MMQLSPFKVFAALLLLFVPSQSNQFLSRLEGSWQGDGKAFGMAANMQLKWEWVLNKKFLRLSLKNEMSAPNGQKQVFEGQAYYQATAADKYEAHWFDSRGVTFPIKAHLEGDALVALWGSPDKEEGKSVYRLVDAGTLEVIDNVKQKDGTWREFGRATLKRTSQ
jgi:lipocalin